MTIKNKNLLRRTILIASLLFILAGIMRGENSEVLQKSINICLQCIGIG